MMGYPSAAQVAAGMTGASTLGFGSRLSLDPLWYYRTGGSDMGSWLSDITGIHISTKGVSLSAPKIPDAILGKKAPAPVPTPTSITINTTQPTTAAGGSVPVYAPVTANTPASAAAGATTATLPDGSKIPVTPIAGTFPGTGGGTGLSAPGPMGIPIYGWLAIGGAAILLMNRK
jgi:hypothetical protein